MSETNNTDPKKEPATGKEIEKDKMPSQEMVQQETIETVKETAEIVKEKGLIGEVAGNIGEGAEKVGEKATELADILVDKLKKGLSQAYEAGAKVVDDLSQAAQEYTEKYKAESGIKKLKGEKNKLMTQLGQSISRHYLSGGGFEESFFNKKEIIDQFSQIDMLDKKIIETGKQLDKGKK